MRFSIIISAIMAVAVTAAPTPDCNEYTCQQKPSPGPAQVGPSDLIGSFIP
ncbi:hypothetical protein LX36DRAFT_715937 [Colletotrichum falcatum]|nr:hypothetical protein LX36DRAFT_715937 [Colletotrichum falcatum]